AQQAISYGHSTQTSIAGTSNFSGRISTRAGWAGPPAHAFWRRKHYLDAWAAELPTLRRDAARRAANQRVTPTSLCTSSDDVEAENLRISLARCISTVRGDRSVSRAITLLVLPSTKSAAISR